MYVSTNTLETTFSILFINKKIVLLLLYIFIENKYVIVHFKFSSLLFIEEELDDYFFVSKAAQSELLKQLTELLYLKLSKAAHFLY